MPGAEVWKPQRLGEMTGGNPDTMPIRVKIAEGKRVRCWRKHSGRCRSWRLGQQPFKGLVPSCNGDWDG